MKNHLLSLLLFFTIVVNAQDSLFMKQGNIYVLKVLEIGHENLVYRQMNSPDTIMHVISLADILYIKYANGGVDSSFTVRNNKVIDNLLPPSQSSTGVAQHSQPSNENFTPYEQYSQGMKDAAYYYHPAKGILSGTFCGGLFLGPLFGLIPAIAVASSDVPDERLGYPDIKKMNSPDYRSGYN